MHLVLASQLEFETSDLLILVLYGFQEFTLLLIHLTAFETQLYLGFGDRCVQC